MGDDPENPSSFLGNPGEPVAEVDPADLKAFWQRAHYPKYPGQHVSIGFEAEAIAKSGANAGAIWYRCGMIWLLHRIAEEKIAPWMTEQEVPDAVFRTMAKIPMEWIGHTERESLPFDVEEFFRRLREESVQNG